MKGLVGLVLNVPVKGLRASLLGCRHWIAIKWMEAQW
jgi:hypothetical protein